MYGKEESPAHNLQHQNILKLIFRVQLILRKKMGIFGNEISVIKTANYKNEESIKKMGEFLFKKVENMKRVTRETESMIRRCKHFLRDCILQAVANAKTRMPTVSFH
jgi:hemerythrin